MRGARQTEDREMKREHMNVNSMIEFLSGYCKVPQTRLDDVMASPKDLVGLYAEQVALLKEKGMPMATCKACDASSPMTLAACPFCGDAFNDVKENKDAKAVTGREMQKAPPSQAIKEKDGLLPEIERQIAEAKVTIVRDIYALGMLLKAVRDGSIAEKERKIKFHEWVEKQGIHPGTAANYIAIVEKYPNKGDVPKLPFAIIYDLVRLPDTQRHEIEALATKATKAEVKKAVRAVKEENRKTGKVNNPKKVAAGVASGKKRSEKVKSEQDCLVFDRKLGEKGSVYLIDPKTGDKQTMEQLIEKGGVGHLPLGKRIAARVNVAKGARVAKFDFEIVKIA